MMSTGDKKQMEQINEIVALHHLFMELFGKNVLLGINENSVRIDTKYFFSVFENYEIEDKGDGYFRLIATHEGVGVVTWATLEELTKRGISV